MNVYPVGENSSDVDLVRTASLKLFLKLIEISKRKIANIYVIFQGE